MAEMKLPKVDSKEGIAMLVSFARGGGFVLSAFHAAIAKKYGVSVDGVVISQPIPAISSGSIYKIVSPTKE